MTTILVTGGAGFIGAALVRQLVAADDCQVVTVDKLTYAGYLDRLADVMTSPRHRFEQVDICDDPALRRIFDEHRPNAVIHLAAETHVDRSIDGPAQFVQTNLVGTHRLLEAARLYWSNQDRSGSAGFRFLHASTDEVFGSTDDEIPADDRPYRPSSPYAATKAGADHLARAWWRTYGLPVLTTHGCNTYGPRQFPEKLVPLMIATALAGKQLPVYGDGGNSREWLHVDDHASALRHVLTAGEVGEIYPITSGASRTNLQVVTAICDILDRLRPRRDGHPYREQIAFAPDRPGHDRRYASDPAKARRELGWESAVPFEAGLAATVDWYLRNERWLDAAERGYRGERLGLGTTLT